MNKLIFTLVCSVLLGGIWAQTNRIVLKANSESIELKWYSNTLVFKDPVDLYRSENNGTWTKMNAAPFRMGAMQPSAGAMQTDPELSQFIDLLTSGKKLEGPALLIVTLKSFKSIPFCNYLGNYFEDKTVRSAVNYQYRIVRLGDSPDHYLAESAQIQTGNQLPELPVDSIRFRTGFRAAEFGWKPEVMRYYGVNIYRSTLPDSLGALITHDPVLVSKIQDANGQLRYPEYFFEDVRLKERQTYYYTFAGLDFFGGEIPHTQKLAVRIKDQTLPEAPVSIRKTVYGKRIDLNWFKSMQDDDFAGYAVYMGQLGNRDTLHYERLNADLLVFTDSSYQVTVPQFGLYSLKVAAVDTDGNEAFSTELVADVIDNEPPSPPVNVLVISDTGRLVVRWNPNPESDILGYRVYRSVKNNLNALTLLTADIVRSTEFTDSLPANARNAFTYAVLAVDTSLNESSLSTASSNVMVDILPPKQPFLKQVTYLEGKNQIEWVRNTETDLAGYHLYRRTGDDTVWQHLNAVLIPNDLAGYTDRMVENGKTYHYQLVAVDQLQNSSVPSNKVSIRLRENKEESTHKVAISRVKFDKAGNAVKVAWKSDVQEGNYQYVLFRRNDGKEFRMISEKNDKLTYRDTHIQPGEKLEYQVRMYDESGKVTRSEIVTFTVPKKRVKTN